MCLPTFTKRAFDNRTFGFTTRKLWAGTTIQSFDELLQSVHTQAKFGTAPDLTLAIDKFTSETMVFTCAGGTSGRAYLLTFHYTASNGDVLEDVAIMKVE